MTKILVVDDEDKIREMIVKYAKHEGFETDEAKDGLEAVEKCEENRYDLVIMDIMMPNLDGFSAVKEIKEFLQQRLLRGLQPLQPRPALLAEPPDPLLHRVLERLALQHGLGVLAQDPAQLLGRADRRLVFVLLRGHVPVPFLQVG